MNEFINVVGENPFYDGLNIRMWISDNLINSIYPIHAVKDTDGKYWKCIPDHAKAEVVSYLILDHSGNKYYCGEEEVEKLGINNEPSKSPIGFINTENDLIQKL